ncbi:MAG: hypothetical protein V9E88_15210 [Ferruginibacter sp.]
MEGFIPMQLINNIGQVVYRASIRMSAGTSRQTVQLGSGIAAGRYQLKLESGSQVILVRLLIIK